MENDCTSLGDFDFYINDFLADIIDDKYDILQTLIQNFYFIILI